MTVRLSTQPHILHKLRSRDVAKILGGALGGVIPFGVTPNQIRASLSMVQRWCSGDATLAELQEFADALSDANMLPRHLTTVLSGLVSGLRDSCKRRAVDDAIDWWLTDGRIEAAFADAPRLIKIPATKS